ncbi:MAG: hypothetical protein IH840_07940, partial [Candidatus Heimdallarchaeota archaeon]|nr:hypothetical protein [Candidatus Heimdallarchaeota archaeon]
HRLAPAHHVPGDDGPVAHRQRQPGGDRPGVRPTKPVRVHADDGAAQTSKRHWKPGEPSRTVLSSCTWTVTFQIRI